MTAPPIFVVGPPRSGTSLLTAALGSHPRMVVCHHRYLDEILAAQGPIRRTLARIRFYATHPERLPIGLAWFGIRLRGRLRRVSGRLRR